MIEKAAVMQATLASSTAIAALVLVLQGFLYSALSALPVASPTEVKSPYKIGIILTAFATGLALLVAVGALLWLLGVDLFWVTTGGFFLSLASVLAISIRVAALAMKV